MVNKCQSGSGFLSWARARISKTCRASIGPDAAAKSIFSVSDMVFTIAGTPCINNAVRNWCDYGSVKLIFF